MGEHVTARADAVSSSGLVLGASTAPHPQVRQEVDLRVLLELRRRLKSSAEKELAMAADRCRSLRNALRRAEAELRLCSHILQGQSNQLMQVVSHTEMTQAHAAQTCARLSSLERENEDLGQQLAQAQHEANHLQISAQRELHARHGTLDSFVLAANALGKELALAIRDQSFVSARTRDLIEESEILSARARFLRSCQESVHAAMTDLSETITEALSGSGFAAEEMTPLG